MAKRDRTLGTAAMAEGDQASLPDIPEAPAGEAEGKTRARVTAQQWEEIDRRLAAGEATGNIKEAVGVSYGTVSGRKRALAQQGKLPGGKGIQAPDSMVPAAESPVRKLIYAMGLAIWNGQEVPAELLEQARTARQEIEAKANAAAEAARVKAFEDHMATLL